MKIEIRRATSADRLAIAYCIAEGFKNDFSILSRDLKIIAKAIAPSLRPEQFFVAQKNGRILGTLAISNRGCCAAKIEPTALRRHFGLLKGLFGSFVMKEDFEGAAEFSAATGYVQFVAIREGCRRKGIATKLLKESMELSGYESFHLEVTDVNLAAMSCYMKLGFREYKRIPQKYAKYRGFRERIFMCRSL